MWENRTLQSNMQTVHVYITSVIICIHTVLPGNLMYSYVSPPIYISKGSTDTVA